MELAESVERARQAIPSLLPGAALGRVEVRALTSDQAESRLAPHVDGAYFDRLIGDTTILIRDNAPDWQSILVHELVHVSLGPGWSNIPPAVEEGLCDVAAEEILMDERGGVMRTHALAVTLHAHSLELSYQLPPRRAGDGPREGSAVIAPIDVATREPSDLKALLSTPGSQLKPSDDRSNPGAYGAGYFIVRRIVDRAGFVGLWDLCQEHEGELVPLVDLLRAADLADDAKISSALRDFWTTERVRTYLDLAADELGPAIAQTLHRIAGDSESLDSTLDRLQPAIAIVSTDGSATAPVTPVAVREVHGLRDSVARHWEAP